MAERPPRVVNAPRASPGVASNGWSGRAPILARSVNCDGLRGFMLGKRNLDLHAAD